MSSDQPAPIEDAEETIRLAATNMDTAIWADDWPAFIAQVKRDAAREALDGLIAEEEESFLRLHVKDAPIAAAQCTHAAMTAREYRDTHYPEETPDEQ